MFDSVHGRREREIAGKGDWLLMEGREPADARNFDIAATDWSDCDIVVEATGKHHKQPERLQAHFDQGVKKVVVPTEGALNIVYGVNHHECDPQVHHLLTAASCTPQSWMPRLPW